MRLSRRYLWSQNTTQRYLVIGGSAYALELLVIVTAQKLGAGSLLAVGLAFWVGLIVSFVLQKIITFGDKRLHHRVVLAQSAAFLVLVFFNFGFTLAVTKLLIDVMPAVACRTLALMITTTWNFYLYKKKIFTAGDTPAPKKQSQFTLKKRFQRKRKQLVRRYKKFRSRPFVKRIRKYASKPAVARTYLWACLAILFATTLLWSILGAKLQQLNADQLVNARLFSDWQTFHGGVFPDQHSFLIKWPLFYLVGLFGFTPAAYIGVTVASVLATVGAFVFVLSRIERRLLVLGSLCLALASALLLVPAQSYDGALLPVSMAMLATRNLEYIAYIASLVLLIRAPRVRSRQFYGAVALLGLLIASDRLFLSVSIGGAILAMVCYSLRRRWSFVSLSARLLLLGVAAGAVAVGVTSLITHTHLTHVAGSQAGPYGLAHSAKSVGIGIIFAVGGVLTNFGANPAYGATTFRAIPSLAWHHLAGPAGFAYVINFMVFALLLGVGATFLFRTFKSSHQDSSNPHSLSRLPILLLWSSLAVTALFVVTDHYYQVDARYLTLWLFALFIVVATWLRPRRVDAELVIFCLPVLLLSIICGSVGTIQTHDRQKHALAGMDRRDKIIARTLANHHARFLVGDYWRVLPVQSSSEGRDQQIVPLQDCTKPRSILTSRSWQPDLHHTGFAYLLTFDGNLTGYPDCSLRQVVAAYGEPGSSALVAGSLAHPKELLLFYDQGTHAPPATPMRTQASATVLPIALDDLTRTTCQGPTDMNIVAHQDDDLLFMSPDLLHNIQAGHCIRTIYLTAGDAGAEQPYWLSREQGSEAAYSEMARSKAPWIQRIVRLPGDQFIVIASPKGNDKISLIFMHLPDGNLRGEGFRSSHNESLAALASKRLDRLHTVDRQSSYTAQQLIDAVTALMHTYQPAEIRTQSSYTGQQYKDHSDHMTTGQFALNAYHQYETQQFNNQVSIPLSFYMGYPIHDFPPNVTEEDLQSKEAAFAAYGAYDGDVCVSLVSCQQNPVYGIYLTRQYQNPY